MKVLWHWPHPHREAHDAVAGSLDPGDHAIVLALDTYRGEPLGAVEAPYEVRRILPDVSHRRAGRWARRLDRGRVHLVRTWRRHRAAVGDGVDVVHVETVTPLLDAVALPLLRRHAAVVLNVHDVVPHRPWRVPAIERATLRRAYRAADRVVVFHDHLAGRLVDEYALDPGVLVVVPLPIPVLHPPVVASMDLDEVTADRPTVLCFGSLRPDKGIPVLLAAVAELAGEPIRFVIAGGGSPAIEALVRAEAASNPALDAVVGFVDADTRHRLFRDATVVVLPYTDDFGSQSGVLFDAYAYGIPCVVSDVGAIGPTVRADGTGWVVPPSDPAALAAALRTACADPRALATAAERVIDRREAHRASAVGRRYAEIHRAALAARLRIR